MSDWAMLAESPLRSRIEESLPPPDPPRNPPSIKRAHSVQYSQEALEARKSVRRSSVKGRESERTMSQRLMRVPVMDSANSIWIEDDEKIWLQCSIIEQDNTVLKVQDVVTQAYHIIDTGFKDVQKANDKVVPDMASLHYLHEPGLLYNICQRFHSSHPYTFMGLILIAVNPLQWFEQPKVEMFAGRPLNPDHPHPYAIAESCYQELSLVNSVNQSVVISGESGSGKTETAKMVLSYLVKRLESGTGRSAKSATGIDNRLIQSSPVLEAFGNSCTLRNPNSSRFGKFLKLSISRSSEPAEFQRCAEGEVNGRIVGATVETYLLEKSRVIHQSAGEQNFHVFYQLLAGQRSGGLDNIGQTCDFKILNEYTSGDVKELHEQFLATRYALETVGYDTNMQAEVWRTLAGILALGNVQFDEVDSAEGGIANVASTGALETSANYFGVSADKLVEVLTRKVMKARGEEFTIRLTVNDACFARDAVCKTIYDALFMDIVKCVNSSLTCPSTEDSKTVRELRYIGVLDIFGFESFAVNRFDQLLINYANESLQNTFNVQVFKSELMLLVEENIECTLDPSMCPDNSGCVQSIWVSPAQLRGGDCSILSTLDAVSRQPKPLDDKFCAQLHADFSKATAKQKYFPPPHPKDKRSSFMVKHFAGVVKYTVGSGEDSWVAKNNDASPDNLAVVLSESRLTVVNRLLVSEVSSETRRGGQINKSTIASSFAKSMASLDNELQSTRCAFVRCIKPNASMTPGVFDNAYVVEQMRALGLVQACEVMRVGLPNRMTYVDLKSSLAPIVSEVEAMCAGESEEVLVASLLLACEVEDDSYRLGKTRVFFKPGKLAALEASIQRAVGSGRREEMLQRLKMVLSSRRELQQTVQKVREGIAVVEAEVASGWVELDTLQKSVTVGSQEDGSTAFAISSSEATSAVDYLGALVEASVVKVNEVRALVMSEGDNSDYNEIRVMVEEVERELSDLESTYRSIKMRQSSLSTQSRGGKRTELHAAALDRWQDMSRIDDILKSVRGCLRTMDGAATKFQADKVNELKVEVASSLQVIRTELASTLALVRDSMTQLGSVSTESSRLIIVAKSLIEDAIKQTTVCEAICDNCVTIKKEFDTLQIQLAKHEDEKRQRELEQEARNKAARAQQEASLQQEAEAVRTVQNRRGSMRGLNVAALRKNIANMSVDRATTNSTDVNSIPPAPDVPPPVDSWSLPAGWEEFFDATNELPYYFNTVTQETQWERPDAPACSVGGQILAVETPVENLSTLTPTSEAISSTDGNRARSSSVAPKLGKNAAADKCSLSYGRITTSQLDTLGVEVKKGVLMKKGSAGLTRFKRKYFVLEGPVLTYYDKAEQYLCGSGGGKEMRLSVASSTAYTDQECTFIVKSPQLAHEKDLSWQLVAENVSSMHEWVAYINAHIHAIHRNLQLDEGGYIEPDEYASMGIVDTTFWRLPVRNEYGPILNPVGIRSTPNVHGPRTGEGVFPGEIVEVVQTINMNDNTFLRLGDDRGWVFCTHPTNMTTLFQQVPTDQYSYIDKPSKYKMDRALKRGIDIQFSPGEGSPTTGQTLRFSDDVECTATWSYLGEESNGKKSLSTFVKLQDGRGWVMSVDSHGTPLLEPVVANPLRK